MNGLPITTSWDIQTTVTDDLRGSGYVTVTLYQTVQYTGELHTIQKRFEVDEFEDVRRQHTYPGLAAALQAASDWVVKHIHRQ